MILAVHEIRELIKGLDGHRRVDFSGCEPRIIAKVSVQKRLKSKKDRIAKIIKMLNQGYTQAEVGRKLNLARQYVNQLIKEAEQR